MREAEEETRRLLAVAVGDIPPGIDLLSGVRRRRTAHRVRLRAALAVGTAGVAAVAAVVTLGASRAPSAWAAVTTAARLTGAHNYQVTMTSSLRTVLPTAGMGRPWTVSGEFSPASRTGEEDGGQVRFVGGYVYTYIGGTPVAARHHGKSWVKTTEPAFTSTRIRIAALLSSPTSLPLTAPQDLLGLLESATRVRGTGAASGPGWTGTGYAFSAALALGAGKNSIMSITGTVGVDPQGRVRRLDTTITEHLPRGRTSPPESTSPPSPGRSRSCSANSAYRCRCPRRRPATCSHPSPGRSAVGRDRSDWA